MNIIVCLDEKNGMSFNNRRQSKDRNLIENVINLTSDHRLFVSEYSAPLFEGKDVIVDNNFLSNADTDDFCFVETADILEAAHKIEKVVIYYWNRLYPSDKKFPKTTLLNGKTLVTTNEFKGSSHDKITMEIYQ